MDPWDHIYLYCERASNGFATEPLNTLSNFIYFIVGLQFLRSRKGTKDDHFLTFLGFLAVLIGAGSTLFHILAVNWSRYADVIPIWAFVVLYILYALRNFFSLPWTQALSALLAIVILSYVSLANVPFSVYVGTHGSVEYLPALVAAIAFSLLLFLRGHQAWQRLAAGSLSLAAALIFRTIDLTYCQEIPIGTHFLWHIFTGIAIFFLLGATSKNSVNRIC